MTARTGLGWRIATALVLAPLVVALTFLAPPWGLIVLAAVAAAAAAHEATGLAVAPPAVPSAFDRVLAAVLAAAVCAVVPLVARDRPEALAFLFPAVFLVVLVAVVLRPGEIPTFSPRAAWLVFAPLYVGLGLAVHPTLRLLFVDGAWWVLYIMTLTFFADTTAYFSGRFLGRHKLHPRLSPKKTVEGSVGGLAGSVLAGLLARFLYLPILSWLDVVVLAFVAGGLGQMGDLFESAAKRSAQVKDSGNLLPGHGGMLDRIDALIPAGMVVLAWALYRGLLTPVGS
jgi:phosphatidate cytidylyltransferase